MKSRKQLCIRSLTLLSGLGVLLLVSQVHALGLGKMKVLSALDEPLVAEIELTATTPEAMDSLEITLGTREDFDRAGVNREEFLKNLEFEVRPGEKPVVVIRTSVPAQEPFLHFLVSAQWADGKLIREFTALLDPPLYTVDKPTAVSTPGLVEQMTGDAPEASGTMAESEQPASAMESAPAMAAPETSTSMISTAGFSGAEYGLTERGDTLWNIASSLDTSGYDVNIFQIMIALLRENPQAFVDNNINRLRTGQILRLTDLDSANAIAPNDASLAYQSQLEEWESYKIKLAEASGTIKVPAPAEEVPAEAEAQDVAAQPSAETATETMADSTMESAAAPVQAEQETPVVSEAEAGATATTEQDLLKIVRATLEKEEAQGTSTSQGEAAAATAEANREIDTLRDQINTLEEALVSREMQNRELQERVALLEGQVENAQRLVELESQEFALAQQQAAAQQEAVEQQLQQAVAVLQTEQAEQSTTTPVAEEPTEQVSEPQQPAEPEPAEIIAQNVVEPITPEQPAAAASTAIADTASDTSARQVSQTMESEPWWEKYGLGLVQQSSMSLFAGAVGVLVVLVGVMLFIRRRRSIAEFEESILSGSGLNGQTDTTDADATSNTKTDTSFLSDFGMAGMGSMQADEVDPLAEAEVYLAYGRDEQAEEVLKEAAVRDPERQELKLKLLEIYKQRNDLKSFETLAEELYPAGENGEGDVTTWAKVVEMGLKMNPDNPLFSEELPGASGKTTDEVPAVSVTDTMLDPTADDETDLPQDIVSQSSDPVDPALQPFPTPDSNAGLDQQLDRLAERVDETAAAAKQDADPAAPSEDSEMLNFATTDPSELDFDMDIGDDEDAVEAEDAVEVVKSAAGDEDDAVEAVKSAAGDEDDIVEAMKSAAGDEDDVIEAIESAAGDEDLELDDVDLTIDLSDVDADTTVQPESLVANLDFELEHIAITSSGGGNGNGGSDKGSNGNGEDAAVNDEAVDGGGWDEAATKLDLAQAYLNMGDKAGARSIIDEVMKEGSPAQKDQAAELATQLG